MGREGKEEKLGVGWGWVEGRRGSRQGREFEKGREGKRREEEGKKGRKRSWG